MTDYYVDNLAHLQGALLILNLELHRQVLRWRAQHHDEASADELAGVYMSDRDVDALLDSLYAANAPSNADGFDQAPIATLTGLLEDAKIRHIEREAASLAAGIPLRLPMLAERLSLNDFEMQVVLLALAPELDRRYDRIFGYLNDDLTRRWPTVDLALQLFCLDLAGRVNERSAFAADSPLRALRVLHLVDDAGTLVNSGLRIDLRIVNYLLHATPANTRLKGVQTSNKPTKALIQSLPIEIEAIRTHYQKHKDATISLDGLDTTLSLAAAAYITDHSPLLVIDAAENGIEEKFAQTRQECYLDGAGLVIQNAQALQPPVLKSMIDEKITCILISTEPLPIEAVHLHLPALDQEARQKVWADSLNGAADSINIAELADRFRLSSGQIAAAARQAQIQAAAFGGQINRADLFKSCRVQSNAEIGQLAQPVRTSHTWEDLILPQSIKAQLSSLEHWMRHRHTVYDDWGFGERIMLGRGMAVLFSGSSGTGKTMAAGILARNLELDLYRIDLSTVVSKYIGETEKNLGRIFDAAEQASAVLFFDEADALFGKRSEVKDAHDRYANIEVSYLLQRMESYDGVAILATNFRQNLDQAFLRRLHMVIEFPLPTANERERIWRGLLPERVPQAEDVDISYLARQFTLSGGNIKNCALNAAFAAAADTRLVSMRHLVQAVARELEKTNQPIVRAHFGTYYEMVRVNGDM